MRRLNTTLFFALLALLTLNGCASRSHDAEQEIERIVQDKPEIIAPQPRTPGSLWTTGRGSLFVDNRATTVGDIVTVIIREQASASKEATTSTARSTSAGADITSLFGLESNIANLNSNIDPANLITAGYTNDFKGSGSTKRKEDLTATIATQVIEVLPNGNMRISGSKSVMVNHEKQLINLSGIIRQQDITPDNEIDSRYILDANIMYSGKGVIDEKQRPGWLLRLYDVVSPF
ncbi:MAG: flagellar basal body L-ring protein FlgH [Desulfuromonadaceae bacterium]